MVSWTFCLGPVSLVTENLSTDSGTCYPGKSHHFNPSQDLFCQNVWHHWWNLPFMGWGLMTLPLSRLLEISWSIQFQVCGREDVTIGTGCMDTDSSYICSTHLSLTCELLLFLKYLPHCKVAGGRLGRRVEICSVEDQTNIYCSSEEWMTESLSLSWHTCTYRELRFKAWFNRST